MKAETIILEHQRTCTEDRIQRRSEMAEIRLGLAAIKTEVNRIINRGLVWVIGTGVVVLGYFLVTYGLPGQHR